jgi:hypothetical protein
MLIILCVHVWEWERGEEIKEVVDTYIQEFQYVEE